MPPGIAIYCLYVTYIFRGGKILPQTFSISVLEMFKFIALLLFDL